MRKIRRQQLLKARREQARKLTFPGFGKVLLFVLAGISLPAIIRLGAHELIHKRKYPLQTAEWKIYSPARTRLSLLLPGEPQPAGVEASASTPAIKQADRYQVAIQKFRVEMSSVSYHEGTPADLRQAAHDVALALKEVGEVTDYQETVIPIQRAGRSGMIVNGSFKSNGEQRQVRTLLLSEGPRLWQVIVTYPASDRAASTASQKIIDSIRVV